MAPRTSGEALLATVKSALAPRYAVVRELGRGGTATVFLAEELESGMQVAVKILHPELTCILGPGRFRQEIDILGRLRHPNILSLLESNAVPPLLYYTAPFVAGESLRALIERTGVLPLEQVLELTGGIAAALDYAHGENVLHRDIKPENVLLDRGRPLVCDFGVARAIERAAGDRISSSGLIIGTPEYMSPEQAAGETALDSRSDVYGLGCVVYEMLSGEQPFTGHSPQAVIARQITTAPRSIRVVRPEVPGAMESAVMSALAKGPADRPRTARLFFERLRAGAGQAV